MENGLIFSFILISNQLSKQENLVSAFNIAALSNNCNAICKTANRYNYFTSTIKLYHYLNQS